MKQVGVTSMLMFFFFCMIISCILSQHVDRSIVHMNFLKLLGKVQCDLYYRLDCSFDLSSCKLAACSYTWHPSLKEAM